VIDHVHEELPRRDPEQSLVRIREEVEVGELDDARHGRVILPDPPRRRSSNVSDLMVRSPVHALCTFPSTIIRASDEGSVERLFGSLPPRPYSDRLAGFASSSRERSGRTMAIGFYFAHGNFTPEKYASIITQLEEAGAGAPAGRTLHVALESDGLINVFDIWESQEEFEAFGSTLLPILASHGVELKEPMAANVHNVIKG
jgi:hypothetical protein